MRVLIAKNNGPGRVQTYAILGECLWITVTAAVMSAIFLLPDQMRELYRIAIVELGWLGYAKVVLPAALIAIVVWCGTKLVTTDGRHRIDQPSRLANFVADIWPALLGALPLFALTGGLFFALPNAKEVPGIIVGSPFEFYRDSLQSEFGSLRVYALITAAFAALFLLTGFALSRATTSWAATANERFFRTWRCSALAVGAIVAMTGAHYLFPELSLHLGVVSTLGLFTICIVGTTAHLTLLSYAHRWPMITFLFGLAILFSLFNLNDNHEVRRLDTDEAVVPPGGAPHAADEFLAWYERRPDLGIYSDDYPVYIVAAQGGGIYAAYQAAVFLARMQDICPAFKDHLFAISAVSGGSLGAAIFTAALEKTRSQAPTQSVQVDRSTSPCPRITAFLSPGATLNEGHIGPVEQEVRSMLSRDFLSPLVGATLFPDFAQRFLPWAFGGLDRARALETSFEAAAPGPLSANFLSHWNIPENRGPALLLNSTDAATGKRVIIAPFALRGGRSKLHIGGLAHFPFWNLTEQQVAIEKPVQIRLSTAASISARFPWLSPAATVTVVEASSGKSQSIRLVDGGYADNSGVETVLDLIKSIEPAVKRIEEHAQDDKQRTLAGFRYVKVKIAVIAMSGGDYPSRTSFSLGETLEPVRALLSTRQSRGYVAIDRGKDGLGREPFSLRDRDGSPIEIEIERLRVSKLTSQFYELPLGWALGKRSRDIIEKQSGRFWECEFNERFEQGISGAARADCLQMLVYHELYQSLPTEVARLGAISRYRSQEIFGVGKRLDNQEFLKCYRDTRSPPATLRQLRAVEAILSIWEKRVASQDDRWLAFALAALAAATADFRFQEENLRYTPQRLEQVFAIKLTEDELRRIQSEGDKAVADIIYGPRSTRGKTLGNTEPGDGWRYRGRGMIMLTGRQNYAGIGRLTNIPLENDPDLLFVPDVGALVAVTFLLNNIRLERYFNEKDEDWDGAQRRLLGPGSVSTRATEHAKKILDCIKKTRRP